MYVVGKINLEIYKCVCSDITTDEVIITEERIEHIKARHPEALERIAPYLARALELPDYILKDKNPNTGLVLKSIEENGLRIQIILRVHTSHDTNGFKSSVISAWEISESRWKNYIMNKEILYKRE